MGSSVTKSFQPEELAVFRNLPPKATVEIPERPENRVPTDRKFLIAFGVCIIILLPFLIYTLVNSDIHRYIIGYDSCGDVCGKINDNGKLSCSGKDVTDKRLLEVSDVNGTKVEFHQATRICVDSCSSGYDEISGYCLKRNYNASGLTTHDFETDTETSRISDYLNTAAWRITLACFLSLAIGFLILFLFRTATAVMVWGILIGVLIFLTIVVIALWYSYTQLTAEEGSQGLLVLAIFFTIILGVLAFLVVFLKKKIALVIILLKESMKATFAMPRLLLVPIVILIAEMLVMSAFVVTTGFMFTAGTLVEETTYTAYYQKNFAMVFAIIFNACMVIWAAQFIAAIHYMIVAGAVSKWYFARNKDHLESPILTSTSITFKFHLGSIAFGSMIITIIIILRSLLAAITRNRGGRCCPAIERFVKFLSKNAYIMTAMHGQPFFKSGKRAVQIIIQNVVNIVAVHFIGNFIIGMAHILVILLSMLVAYLVMLGADDSYVGYVYLIVFLVSIVVSAICFSIFETTISTIFLCFCEDCILNDGMTRPYAMSPALIEFMDTSKTLFPKKKT